MSYRKWCYKNKVLDYYLRARASTPAGDSRMSVMARFAKRRDLTVFTVHDNLLTVRPAKKQGKRKILFNFVFSNLP